MSFEAPSFESESKEKTFYEKARERTDNYLENFKFTENKEVININPEKPKDEVPVFFSPGWGVRTTSESIMKTIAEQDRKVISTFFSREEKIINDEENIPVAELQKALAIIEIINNSRTEKVDAIGHSEGGLNLMLAASLYPEKFRNIVLMAPAGMMKNDTKLSLVKRFLLDEGIEERNQITSNFKSFISYLKDVSYHALKNADLTNKEIEAMTQMDIFEMMKELKGKGVKVGLVCGVNDKVFPIEEVLKNMGKEDVDHFISTTGNHGSTTFDKRHVELAENLLSNMAKE